ncbi:MAG: mercuric reductase [Bdellovibrionales bacterium]|nr:mercuric reductase [Bdellovibrionales bacterium]
MKNDTYNLAVLGAGSGGLVCAAGAAGLGAKVLLIEKHKMGGDCLNTGCVPSKALIKSAKIAVQLRHADRYGVRCKEIAVDFRAVMERVQSIIRTIEPHDSPERFRSLGVDVEFGPASFVSPNEVTNGEKTFRAKRIVVATGSRPHVPAIEGLSLVQVLTSENVWELRELPEKLVVIGGGPIGCELAQCFARFGSHVTVLTNGKRLLERDDIEASATLAETFFSEGIEVKFQAEPRRIVQKNGTTVLEYANSDGATATVDCTAVLLAAGRRPNLEELNLDAVGIRYTSRGIEVNDNLQTSLAHVYACGDVAGPYLFTHTADFQARAILRNALFPGSKAINYRVVPWCTYTDPEIAQVGLTESAAKQTGIGYVVTRYDLKDLDRAICDGTNRGFVKVLTEKGKDSILGATLVGEHAGDLLHEFVVAMQNKIGLKKLAGTIHVYPTLAEGPKRAADAWMRTLLTESTKRMLQKYFAWSRG